MKYSLKEAARYIGVKPKSLAIYSLKGRIQSENNNGEPVFEKNVLDNYMMSRRKYWRRRDRDSFEARFDADYGDGSYGLLLLFLYDKTRYMEIANEFGVSVSLVKHWKNSLGTGRERRANRKAL